MGRKIDRDAIRKGLHDLIYGLKSYLDLSPPGILGIHYFRNLFLGFF